MCTRSKKRLASALAKIQDDRYKKKARLGFSEREISPQDFAMDSPCRLAKTPPTESQGGSSGAVQVRIELPNISVITSLRTGRR